MGPPANGFGHGLNVTAEPRAQDRGQTGQVSAGTDDAGRTPRGLSYRTPLRDFLRTQSGSAVVLLLAALAALVWANVDLDSYTTAWGTELSVRVGDATLTDTMRGWVNDGLMAVFFFVIGLEARREFDVGELRERQRLALPLLAGLAGMVVPVAIYLAINAGRPSAHGWGAAMSSDTAFALGMLALVGSRFPDRLRTFMLTVLIVDDLVALVVIAVAYTQKVTATALYVAVGLFAVVIVVRALKVRSGLVYGALAVAVWVAMFESGVDAVVAGLAMGLIAYAYPAHRSDLEEATQQFRLFREQPTAELARQARASVDAAISPNERMTRRFHPWSSYVVVPLFALANIGIPLDLHIVADAFTSPITLGILIGYVAGKPAGIMAMSWLVHTLSRGRLTPSVGWASVAGGGAIAGIGFTLSLLISSLAFSGDELREAKIGVLAAAAASCLLSWAIVRGTFALPRRLRLRALLGTSESIVDLADDVDPKRDHVRGPEDAAVTLVEYGDLECPYCGRAEATIRELLADYGDLRYVWRHLPLHDVHPLAQLAAEATEAAGAQDRFWEMHDLLFEHQDALTMPDLVEYARELGLDVDRFVGDLREHTWADRVAADVDSADVSGVSGTPTFFVNGRRHNGSFSIEALSASVRAARARAAVGASRHPA